MSDLNIKEIIENLIDTFFHAGEISIKLREEGLTKKLRRIILLSVMEI